VYGVESCKIMLPQGTLPIHFSDAFAVRCIFSTLQSVTNRQTDRQTTVSCQ